MTDWLDRVQPITRAIVCGGIAPLRCYRIGRAGARSPAHRVSVNLAAFSS